MKADTPLLQRKNIRLPCYDYSLCGGYFVTLCTEKHVELLSEVGRGGALLRNR